MSSDIYYQVQGSRAKADDWFNMTNDTFDTPEESVIIKNNWAVKHPRYEFRVIRKTITTEVVDD